MVVACSVSDRNDQHPRFLMHGEATKESQLCDVSRRSLRRVRLFQRDNWPLWSNVALAKCRLILARCKLCARHLGRLTRAGRCTRTASRKAQRTNTRFRGEAPACRAGIQFGGRRADRTASRHRARTRVERQRHRDTRPRRLRSGGPRKKARPLATRDPRAAAELRGPESRDRIA